MIDANTIKIEEGDDGRFYAYGSSNGEAFDFELFSCDTKEKAKVTAMCIAAAKVTLGPTQVALIGLQYIHKETT